MAKFDWVPWFGYSTSQFTNVAATTTGQFPMLDLAGSGFDPSLTVGDIEDQNRFFLHRIVGQVEYGEPADTGISHFDTVILPGLVEQTGGNTIQTIIGAGSPAGGIWTDEFSNNEFWYHRHFGSSQVADLLNTGIAGSGQVYVHPWWTFIDIKPKRVIAKGFNPVLAFCNPSAGNLPVKIMLRALVSRL